MQMLINIILLLIGFVLLTKGADFFVDGASSISKKFKIPPVIIGLTVVALGTSCPEAAVSISAALRHNNAIAVSNVAGSNIFNILIVIGVCALFNTIIVQKDIAKRDYPICIGLSVFALLAVIDGTVSRLEGIILVACFFAYVILLIVHALKEKEELPDEIKEFSIPVSILFLIGGLAAIVIGGDLVVDYASAIAKALGMSDTLVGLTIVAFGTSLPELITSITAIKKGVVDLAVGNVIGSNIYNIVFVLGASATISPIGGLTNEASFDFAVALGAVIISFAFCVKSKSFNRGKGAVMVILYAAYMAYIICRNYGVI
jgi:cation:H+ antiporter